MSMQPETKLTAAEAVGPSEARRLSEASLLSNEKRIILGFQVAVSIAVIGAFLTHPDKGSVPWQFYVAACAYVISVLVFAFEPGDTFETKRSQFLVVLFSLATLATCLLLLGLSHKEFYLALLLTIFMSAISKKASYAFLISAVMAGLYIMMVLQLSERGGSAALVSPAFMIRMIVFFVVSSFVGHISEVAETRKEDVKLLMAWRKKVEAFSLEQDKMAAVGLLAAGVAHEFNNLLAGIKGYADLAKIDAVDNDEFIEVVSKQCQRAASIVRDLLSFSRQRSEGLERVDLAKTVEQILRLIQKELDAREIALVKNVRSVRDVRAEPGVLGRTVLNLVSNALEAVESGGEISVSLEEAGDEAVLTVRDNGRGMSSEEQAHAFEPFFTRRGEDSKRVAMAAGVGLAVSKHLVEKCGGTVTIDSALGKGSSVSVRLPTLPGTSKAATSGPLARQDRRGETREARDLSSPQTAVGASVGPEENHHGA